MNWTEVFRMSKRLLAVMVFLAAVWVFPALGQPDVCNVCGSLGNGSYPVLNEVQITADGKYAQLEIVNCAGEARKLTIPAKNPFGWEINSYYPANPGFNVFPMIDVWENRLVVVRTMEIENTMAATYVRVGNVIVPEAPSENVSYQRAPDLVGSFVWKEPTFGKPNGNT